MTKKHFIAMAIQFGLSTRIRLNDYRANRITLDEYDFWYTTYVTAINDFCKVAKQFNSNFDVEYFLDFVADVAMERRDAQGKLIKKGKVA